MQSTAELVKSALVSTLERGDVSSINMEDHLKKDLYLDSMSSLMFLMRLEESIDGFYVDPETLKSDDLETVTSVTQYVDRQLNEKVEYVH